MGWLLGRSVVVTRAAHQAGHLSDQLRQRGASVVLLPLIATEFDNHEISKLDALDLATFDWILVTSPVSAEILSQSIGTRWMAPQTKLAAVGSATARGLPICHLVPSVQSAAGLVQALNDTRFHADQSDDPPRALVIQARGASSTLVAGLEGSNWVVKVIQPYRTVTAVPSAESIQQAINADALLLASGSAARAWAEVVGLAGPPLTVALGPQTASEATRLGLKISYVSSDHSVNGMVTALDSYSGQLD